MKEIKWEHVLFSVVLIWLVSLYVTPFLNGTVGKYLPAPYGS
jgi:hypothetical protein